MDIEPLLEPIVTFLLGLFIGVISAYLGLGGGIVIVPLLPEISQMPATHAIATSLLTIFLVVSNNCRGFHKKKLVIWSVALLIGPFTGVGAFLSGQLTQWVPDLYLRTFLAVLVSFVLVRAVRKSFFSSQNESQRQQGHASLSRGRSVGTGLFAGLLSGVSGIGAGLIVSPLLLNLKMVKNQEVSPTANGVMMFTTFFGCLAFVSWDPIVNWQWGAIHLDKALLLAGGAWISSYFARSRQQKMSAFWRGTLLTLLLAFLTIKMWSEIAHKLFS